MKGGFWLQFLVYFWVWGTALRKTDRGTPRLYKAVFIGGGLILACWCAVMAYRWVTGPAS